MQKFQSKQLAANLLSTASLVASVVAPVTLAIIRGNSLWLLLLVAWPICVGLMGAVKHANAPFWLPGIAIGVFLMLTPVPTWYWLIALATMLAYHIQMNELPVLQSKLNSIFVDETQ